MNTWTNDIKKHLALIDWFLVITVLLAMAYGFVLINSATNAIPGQTTMLVTHAAAIVLGIICMFMLSKSDYNHILRYAKYLYIFSAAALIITLAVGVGDEVGNRSWIRVPVPGWGTVGFQPSEIIKIVFILTLAKHLDTIKEDINNPKNILLLLAHFLIFFALILTAGDLGNNLIYACVFMAMCFAAGMSAWYFLAGAFILTASSPLLWNLMPDYRQDRILAGFTPEIDPLGYGYQALMSQRAIGTGGLFGTGYQQGFYTQNALIPKQWTDFIYSAAGEEFGFVGALLVIILLTLIIVRIYLISRTARNTSGSLICVGVMAIFIAQTVENIGMCLAMLPVIGITLPFFSYGGSSILSSCLGIGIVLSVNCRKNIFYFTRDESLDKF
jgi:rod shape determining protein RodA